MLDSTLCYLNTINTNYICTGIAGVDSYDSIVRGRYKGKGGGVGVAIIYYKKIAIHITHIKSTNRLVCGIILNYEEKKLLYVTKSISSCDNFSNV